MQPTDKQVYECVAEANDENCWLGYNHWILCVNYANFPHLPRHKFSTKSTDIYNNHSSLHWCSKENSRREIWERLAHELCWTYSHKSWRDAMLSISQWSWKKERAKMRSCEEQIWYRSQKWKTLPTAVVRERYCQEWRQFAASDILEKYRL